MEKISLEEFIKLPIQILAGKIIIFPTDTVYGVGCVYEDAVGIEKIYQMKKRDYGKPLPVLCAGLAQVEKISQIEDYVYEYTKYWPGALTIILNKKNSKDETIAVRIPNSSVALKILDHFGPMHVTSVNYSGEKELNDINEIEAMFNNYVDYLITDQVTLSKTPSTIISCLSKEMKIIRYGSIKF